VPAPARAPAALKRALALFRPDLDVANAPMIAGYLDLLEYAEREPRGRSTGLAQDLMLSRAVPAVYERWWRPALGRVAKGLRGPSMADEHRIARMLLDLEKGDGVLDVACGTGNYSRDFGRAVGQEGLVVGLDVSQTMLARAVRDTARGDLRNVAYVRADAQEPIFRDASFDGVCCFAALHLFADPMAALDRFTAALTPGGRIALLTSVRGRSAGLRLMQQGLEARSGMRMFEPGEVLEALETRGFDDLRQGLSGMTQFVGGRLAA